jgi:hypothetical protein
VRKLFNRCVRLHGAGKPMWRLLVSLRLAIGACHDDIDASHVRPIAGNVLRAMTRLRVV